MVADTTAAMKSPAVESPPKTNGVGDETARRQKDGNTGHDDDEDLGGNDGEDHG